MLCVGLVCPSRRQQHMGRGDGDASARTPGPQDRRDGRTVQVKSWGRRHVWRRQGEEDPANSAAPRSAQSPNGFADLRSGLHLHTRGIDRSHRPDLNISQQHLISLTLPPLPQNHHDHTAPTTQASTFHAAHTTTKPTTAKTTSTQSRISNASAACIFMSCFCLLW